MNLQILDLTVSLVGLVLLFALWYGLLQPLFVSHLRQDLFDARDYLFDLASDKSSAINFESEVYRGTRDDLNKMIRAAGEISFFEAVICGIFCRKALKLQEQKMAKLRSNLSDEELVIIKAIDSRQYRSIFRYLLFASPLMWLTLSLVAVTGIFVILGNLIKNVSQFCEKKLFGGGLNLIAGGRHSTESLEAYLKGAFAPTIRQVELQSGQKYLSSVPCSQ